MYPTNLLGGGRLTKPYGNCLTAFVGGFSREVLGFDISTGEPVLGVGINEQNLLGMGIAPYSVCMVRPFEDAMPLAIRAGRSSFQVVPLNMDTPEALAMSPNGELVFPLAYDEKWNWIDFGFSEGEEVIIKTDILESLGHLYRLAGFRRP
ncbi:MAG: hypothetical protein ACP5E4_03750 [Candidatus Aenigmatarchaeota archaeon]